MSTAELLEEFVKLTPAERDELWEALWELEERDRLGVSTPTADEKAMLDLEMEDYQKKTPRAGSPWAEVQARLRSQL